MAAPFDCLVIAPPTPDESSSQMRHQPYDIFINHYGEDAKYGIASDIYNELDATGLRVFLDKDELRSGDFFPETLEAAMRSSSVHIAIFSENYAQSPWCMAELEFILQLPGIKFIPIFYHVEPSTLRWAIKGKGIYGEAFNDHAIKSRYNSKKLENWKLALHKASYYIGEIISNQGEEEKAVNNVVNLVLKELKKVRIDVAKHPVGLDEAEQDFNNTLLNSAAGEVQMVGIWGMGGAGKTTLAKHLFNKKSLTFNGRSCFVSDVREAARKEALYDKQKELLKGLDLGTKDFNNIDKGKEILRGRLKYVPVLIVLDDVDNIEQLDALVPDRDSLGKGSLIVVTTRELRVLKAWGISVIYNIRALNAAHAKELFCWHAFGQPSPLLEFEDLAEKFIDACHGLPLSLKVFGGLLCGEYSKKYWQSQLDKVSRIVPDDIKSRLRISYDALDEEEKEMFLDVACFFIGYTSSEAIAVWDGSEWNGLHGWQCLVNKCLVELDQRYNGIRMHDHLRDLGREIANTQSPYRLWSKTQIIKIQPQQVAVRVRGMADAIGDNCRPLQGHIILNTNQGERTLQPGSLGLKIFIGDGDFVDEQCSELSKELLYLQWSGFRYRNLPSWLPLKKLRILHLRNPERLQGLWERDADAPSALKELFVSNAYKLEKIESLKSLTSLEELMVDGCPELHGLPGLGESTCLRIIELTRCKKLQKIENLKSLTLLEELRIDNCPELDGLPGLGEPTSLRKIRLIGCKKLQKIENLRSLTSLEELRMDGCPELDGLPGLGESTSLRIIELRGCHKLQKIENLRSLTSLEVLWIHGCPELDGLPGLGESTSLRKIRLIGCKKLQKMENLKSLTSLEELRIDGCPELDGLPGLGESTSLRIIELRRCHKLQMENLKSLTSLEELWIHGCPELDGLPGLGESTSLRKIRLRGCHKLQKMENLKSLTSLKELMVDGCPELDGLPGLGESTSLRIIELTGCHKLQKMENLKSLTSLEELWIHGCPELDGLPGLGESTSLRKIRLRGCKKLQKMENLKSLTSLEELRIDGCPKLDGLPGLGESTSLRIIELTWCKKLQKMENLKSLISLEELWVDGCKKLDGLSGLGESTSLRIIELTGCHKLQKMENLKSLTSLKELRIGGCPELDGLPGLGESTSLRIIELTGCHKLQKMENLKSLTSLEVLWIHGCPELDGLPGLGESTSLRKIRLIGCKKLQKMENLKSLTSLEELRVDDCPELDGLPGLGESTSLRKIRLTWCKKLQKIESLKSLTSLEELRVDDCPELDGLPGLGESTSLSIIELTGCHKLQNIKGLISLTSLETLMINDCRELVALPSLVELTLLKTIEVRKCHNCKKIEGIGSLRLLETMIIHDCKEFDTLPNLSGLTSLVKLELIKCSKLEKIGGLESLSSLKMLRIEDCPELDTLPSLVKLTLLEEFNLDGIEVHARLKPPCAVNLEQREGLKSLIVTANDLSVVKALISKIQTTPSEVITCARAAIDVGLLKNFFSCYPLKKVVEFTSYGGLKLRRPQYADDANAILICFIIDSLYPKIHFHINADTGSCFDAVLGSGKWLWMGVFPRGSDWLQSKWYEIWASSEDKDVKLKEVWLVMGKQGNIRQAFHHLSQINES